MHGLPPVDPGRIIDWGRTSPDYARFRPGPPDGFYERLRALDIGLPGQRILDLGTGTGVLARAFARGGCQVAGTDISPEQIATAARLAGEEGLDVDFQVAAAESQPFAAHSFDVITANQCWLYFDKSRVIPEVQRLLRLDPKGALVTSHFSWLPREDAIARKSEELVLRFNPQWSAADFSGEIPPFPKWAEGHFKLRAMFYFDADIPFTIDAWCGRIRACRGIGAALAEDEVRRFDGEHRRLLERLTDGRDFTIRHRIDAHIFIDHQ